MTVILKFWELLELLAREQLRPAQPVLREAGLKQSSFAYLYNSFAAVTACCVAAISTCICFAFTICNLLGPHVLVPHCEPAWPHHKFYLTTAPHHDRNTYMD